MSVHVRKASTELDIASKADGKSSSRNTAHNKSCSIALGIAQTQLSSFCDRENTAVRHLVTPGGSTVLTSSHITLSLGARKKELK